MPVANPRCQDGCGERTLRPEAPFLPGHAVRYAAQLRRRAMMGDRDAFAELYTRGWVMSNPDENLAFGFEAEFFGIRRETAVNLLVRAGYAVQDDGYHHQTKPYWRITSDGSVNAEGNELVSPILRLGKAHIKDMRSVTKVLRENGGQVDRSCGLHVHHNASKLDVPDVTQLVGHWSLFQPTINTILPKTRIGAQYARPMFGVEHWMTSIENYISNMDGFRRPSRSFGRYHAVNLESIAVHNSIEFRQHSGTLNSKKIEMWARLTKLFIGLHAAGKNARTLLRQYDNDEPSVNAALGLQGMLDYVGATPEMKAYYEKRQIRLEKNNDREDADSNEDLSTRAQQATLADGSVDGSGTRRFCAFHGEWHPYDQWAPGHSAQPLLQEVEPDDLEGMEYDEEPDEDY